MVTVVGGFSNWCAWTGCLAETGSEAGKVFSIASSSCPYRKSNPYVLMVQPARFGPRNDVSHIGNVIGSDLDRFAGVYDGCKIAGISIGNFRAGQLKRNYRPPTRSFVS